MADGDASHGTGPADMSNELMEFVAVSIKLEGPDDGGMPHICLGGTQMRPGDVNGLGIHTDGVGSQTGVSTGHRDVSSVETDLNIPAQTQNSPYMTKIAMLKSTCQWKRVGVGDINVCLRWNAPVEVSGQTFAFGEVESGDEAIVPVVEGETACNGDGDSSGDDGDVDMDSTTSGSNVDSIRVEVAQLAGESQHVCYS